MEQERFSFIQILERFEGTKDESEAACLVLRSAADHLCCLPQDASDFLDDGDADAVELLDRLRDEMEAERSL